MMDSSIEIETETETETEIETETETDTCVHISTLNLTYVYIYENTNVSDRVFKCLHIHTPAVLAHHQHNNYKHNIQSCSQGIVQQTFHTINTSNPSRQALLLTKHKEATIKEPQSKQTTKRQAHNQSTDTKIEKGWQHPEVFPGGPPPQY